MTFETLIASQAVFAGVRADDKRRLLEWLAEESAKLAPVARAGILAALTRREQLGSTGIGNGVALPHVRLAAVSQPTGLVATLKAPIAFDAIDGAPVDLVCLLLLPETGSDAINALARVARLLRDAGVAARLRSGRDPAELCAILYGAEPA